MSIVTVAEIKEFLRVIHNADDALLLTLVTVAEDEALQYLDRDSLPITGADYPTECDTAYVDQPASDSADLAPSVRQAIYYWVQAKYEGKVEDIEKLRRAGEALLAPYRAKWGA